MRRLLMGIVVVGLMLVTGVSYAQDSGPAVPAKVRAFLNRLTGNWDCGGSFEGTNEVHWDADGAVLIDTGQFKEEDSSGTWSGVWYWDGLSEDSVIVSWGSPADQGFSHGRLEGKVLSPTVMEARRTGVRLGQPITANVRIEFQTANRYTWAATDVTVGGEQQPDYTDIYTRAQPTSDEETLVELQQEWCRAEKERDVVALGRLLANEYVLVISDGTPLTRAQLIGEVQSGQSPTTGLAVEDTKVRLYGDMAVVKGIVKWSDTGGTRHQSLFTETWQKRDGRWQCLATHESGERILVEAAKTAGYEKMKRLVGTWTYEGQTDARWQDTPFGPAGTFKGQFSAQFVLNGTLVQERWEDTYESGDTLAGLNIYRYDAETGNIIGNEFMSDGSRSDVVYTFEGDTLRARFEQVGSDGQESLVRAVWKYGPGFDTFKAEWELSLDEGKTWKPWLTYEAKKRQD